jgi:hypothetical protein
MCNGLVLLLVKGKNYAVSLMIILIEYRQKLSEMSFSKSQPEQVNLLETLLQKAKISLE